MPKKKPKKKATGGGSKKPKDILPKPLWDLLENLEKVAPGDKRDALQSHVIDIARKMTLSEGTLESRSLKVMRALSSMMFDLHPIFPNMIHEHIQKFLDSLSQKDHALHKTLNQMHRKIWPECEAFRNYVYYVLLLDQLKKHHQSVEAEVALYLTADYLKQFGDLFCVHSQYLCFIRTIIKLVSDKHGTIDPKQSIVLREQLTRHIQSTDDGTGLHQQSSMLLYIAASDPSQCDDIPSDEPDLDALLAECSSNNFAGQRSSASPLGISEKDIAKLLKRLTQAAPQYSSAFAEVMSHFYRAANDLGHEKKLSAIELIALLKYADDDPRIMNLPEAGNPGPWCLKNFRRFLCIAYALANNCRADLGEDANQILLDGQKTAVFAALNELLCERVDPLPSHISPKDAMNQIELLYTKLMPKGITLSESERKLIDDFPRVANYLMTKGLLLKPRKINQKPASHAASSATLWSAAVIGSLLPRDICEWLKGIRNQADIERQWHDIKLYLSESIKSIDHSKWQDFFGIIRDGLTHVSSTAPEFFLQFCALWVKAKPIIVIEPSWLSDLKAQAAAQTAESAQAGRMR